MSKNRLKDKRKNEEVFAMVCMDKEKRGYINVQLVGRESQREISLNTFVVAKEFVDAIPIFFTPRFKAVVLFCDLDPPGFKSNLEFCKAVKAQLIGLGIPHYFITPSEYIASNMLIQAAVDIKFGETVLFVIVCNGFVNLAERQYTQNGYVTIHLNIDMVPIDPEEDPQAMCDTIMGTSNPQKILLMPRQGCQATCKFLKSNVLKSKRSIITEVEASMSNKFITEWGKWILDKTYTKYYVAPFCHRPITISGLFENVPLIKTNCLYLLPIEKSAYVSKVNGLVTSTYTSFHSGNELSIGTLELPQQCHRVKVTLSMDTESIPSIKCDAIRLTNVEEFPQMLNEKMKATKIPVIGFYDDCSVICVYSEEEKGYKFLDLWNGVYGKALAMSFDAGNPLFGSNVYGKLNLNPASVVYDILKVMAISPVNIQINKHWPFKITKDEKKQILLEFGNYGGTRRAATPTFLMAILLKEHIKAIKTETDKDYTEFGCFYFHNFTQDEEARVDKQMQESFELLKMKYISVLSR